MQTGKSTIEVVMGWRTLIVRVTAAAAVVSVIVSLVMPLWYEATTTCLPPQEGESRGSLLSMFTQIGMDFGAAGLLSSTPMTDTMIGVLKSRLVRGQVVDRFDLATVYGSETRDHAIKELDGHLVVDTTPEGFVEVRVEDRDRQRAADMANAFMEFLDEYNRRTSVEQATRTREFVEDALEENGARLAASARKLQEFQERHKAIDLTEQTRVTVEAIALLQSERTALEIERGVLEDFSRPDQMRMRQIEARLREIDDRLEDFVGGGDGGGVDGSGVVIPMADIPALGYELADLTREVLVHEKVRAFLSSQLEDARIQETRDLEIIHVLDEAVPPIKKSRPRRSLIVMLTTVLAFVASVGTAFSVESLLDYAERADDALRLSDSKAIAFVLSRLRRLRAWGRPRGEGEGPASTGP